MSGLLLTGTFSLSTANPDAVGTDMVKTVTSAVAEADRPSTIVNQGFTFFIEAVYDINASILRTSSDATDNRDDAYGLELISLNNSNYLNPIFNLPQADFVPVEAGLITASAGVGLSGSGSFPVTLTVSLDKDGNMTTTTTVSGTSVIASVAEDPTKAQIVHWPTVDGTPVCEATSADQLSDAVTASELNTQYSAVLTTINDKYNGSNMISSWSIVIDAIDVETDSAISKFAQNNGKAGEAAVFNAGQKIVCQGNQEYTVSIEDYTGSRTEIASGLVFGVITQS